MSELANPAENSWKKAKNQMTLTPLVLRALPPSSASSQYTSYEVVKPLPVKSGTAASWFDQPGEGTQYQLQGVNVQQMIDDGYLKVTD